MTDIGVVGRSHPMPQAMSGKASLTGWLTGVRYAHIHCGEYRVLTEQQAGGGIVMLWHGGHRVGWVGHRWDGVPVLHRFSTCDWLTGRLADEVLAATVAACRLDRMAVAA